MALPNEDKNTGFKQRKGDTWSAFDGEPSRSDKRYYDEKRGLTVVKIYSGDFYVTNKPNEVIMTILGSCVAACIRDPALGIGGMNHFLLPKAQDEVARDASYAARYGAYAMEELINGILRLGGRKDRLEVKVFGGGNVINNSAMIGDKNVQFVLQFLKDEGLKVAGSDLGGAHARRINYYPDTGKVMLRRLTRETDEALIKKQEAQFSKTIVQKPVEGDIELFD